MRIRPALLASALALAPTSPAAEAMPPIAADLSTLTPRSAAAYWTPERMAAATPAGLPRDLFAGPAMASARVPFEVREMTNTTDDPNRVHGRIFGEFPGLGGFSCSGTVVTSGSRSLITTAGHCVFDAGGTNEFVSNFVFVPGYRDGDRPFGVWPAAAAITPGAWARAGSLDHDSAFVRLQPNTAGTTVEDAVGARGIAFEQPRDQRYAAYGYPASPADRYDGERLFRCSSRAVRDIPHSRTPSVGVGCDMKSGSSGGGYVIQDVFVASSVSHGHPPQIKDVVFGPHYGRVIKRLYTADGPRYRSTGPLRCRGRVGTLIATGRAEAIRGTRKADVIVAGDGDDTISGGRGRDVICAGAGDDRVSSGDGRDRIDGGPGADACNGGRGKTKISGCERR